MGNETVDRSDCWPELQLTYFPLKSLKRRFSPPPLSPQALLLNGSLPEDEQEGSFELSERGACPEEQLVRTSK